MKKLIIIPAIALAVLSSCRDTKRKASSQETTNTTTEIKASKSQKEREAQKEKRRLDSIQQVKSHGHAH
ncbi:hypothetical protein [Polaribacter sp.]|jgi:hypothetical protein|uniref:hypothetical protein n=1 Tax=Polaribacter sp. TaxID=1920175 RepID=UPI0040474065|tara:strand:+ start:8887 stop:9093 length:207 start_codon:yes stop_codon:yes gene_type:complete